MPEYTPMMQQYLALKAQNSGCLLMFRLGDFYELFFDDARTASAVLDITLTGRDAGTPERVPMCGVPYHALNGYLTRLLSAGYRVAICDQMEDPALAKGLVRREVTRVVTPGTVLDPDFLAPEANNYVLAVWGRARFGVARADISTGELVVSDLDSAQALVDELLRVYPAEIIVPSGELVLEQVEKAFAGRRSPLITERPLRDFEAKLAYERVCAHFDVMTLQSFGVSGDDLSVRALGALFAYLQETARGDLRQFQKITPAASGSGMLIDYTARRNLELFESLRSGERRGSLLWVLDQTVTPLGARSIRHMLESPLYSLDAINSRLDAVEELARRTDLRGTLRQALKTVKDIERLAVRSGTPQANARDLRALGDSLKALPALKDSLQGAASGLLAELAAAMPLEAELAATLTTALVETPPLTVREGGMIASGYDAEVDRLRVLTNEQGEWLSAYEERERTRTGVKTLKVGFNKVFGYYVEVSKANTKDLPAEYVRKQTLVNAERYITEELKRFEDEILTASDQLVSREYELFEGLRAETAAHRGALLRAAERVGCIDALASLAEVAVKNGYVRPRLNNAGRVDIRAGRHPVIEQVAGRHKFVENDTALDEGGILLITGPNMAGKSTYMRQVALIVIMAQMGSFVPAASADIGLVDRVFTRVGAADDLFSGQSTFMVEMTEVANILHNATHESLIILDEIGRGTSTYDGMSIARAVVEYIHSNRRLRSRTLFATHYHELTRLDEELDHLRNLSMAVLEQGDDVVFLRKVVSGGTDRSYGIHVARLAGLPEDVINRARKVLGDLETKQANPALRESAAAGVQQIGLFMTHPVLDRLMSMDLNRVTPMDALALLYDFQSQVRAERGGPGRE